MRNEARLVAEREYGIAILLLALTLTRVAHGAEPRGVASHNGAAATTVTAGLDLYPDVSWATLPDLRADEAITVATGQAEEPAAEPSADVEHRLLWDPRWDRFGIGDYVLTGATLAGAAVNFFVLDPPKTALWKGGILFDEDVQRVVRTNSNSRQRTVSLVADVVDYSLVAYPFIVDAAVTTWWRDHNRDVAQQLILINSESFGVTAAINALSTHLARRRRPKGNVCDPDSPYDPHCVKSFVSGHAANAFTAAGLICAQHQALPLYGGGAADTAACATSLLAATAVSFSRIVSNDHYTTDVVAGAAVGLFSGYLMPNLLHFHFTKMSAPVTSTETKTNLGTVMPLVSPDTWGLLYSVQW